MVIRFARARASETARGCAGRPSRELRGHGFRQPSVRAFPAPRRRDWRRPKGQYPRPRVIAGALRGVRNWACSGSDST